MTKEEIIKAVKFTTKHKEISDSMLQIEFKKGYNWAYKMADILEKNGIVGPRIAFYKRKVIDNNSYEKIIVIHVDTIEP